MVWAGGDPQVVDRQGRIQRLGRRLHLLPQGVGALIIDHWVGVDHRLNVVLGLQLPLDVVDDVVHLQQIGVRRDLRVEGHHGPAGSVVVINQVVDAQDVGVGQHQLVDVCRQLRIHGPAQQGVQRVLSGLPARLKDKRGHQQAGQAVHLKVQKVVHQGGGQHHGGGYRVGERIGRRGLHCLGGDGLPQDAVKVEHPNFHPDGHRQDGNGQPGEGQLLRVEQLFQGALPQLKAHQQDGHGHQQAAEVLDPPVSEGVLLIRRLPGQPEADQRDHRRGGVRQVVQPVRHHGDGASEQPCPQLSQTQQGIQQDAHASRQCSAPLPDLRSGGVRSAQTAPGQCLDQCKMPPCSAGANRPRQIYVFYQYIISRRPLFRQDGRQGSSMPSLDQFCMF